MNKKVLVIFPFSDPMDGSHYPYWYRLFDNMPKSIDLIVIYEKGELRNTNKVSLIQKQAHISSLRIVNIIWRWFLMIKYVLAGYTNIYIHYSYFSFILAFLLKFIYPVTIYYWNCEFYTNKPANRLLIWVLTHCDYLVTGSKMIGLQYQKIFNIPNHKIKIVPNWVEKLTKQRIHLNNNLTHIIFVHHLSPRKGSRILPEIVIKTLAQCPNIHFHIIGSGPDFDYLNNELVNNNKLNLASHVSIHGQLPLTQVHKYMSSCDIFIMPSLSEGFPRVILEAMLYKLAIVSTDVGNVKELVVSANYSIIVKPGNANTFVKSLVEVIKSNKNFNKIKSDNLNKVSSSYNISAATNAFINLF